LQNGVVDAETLKAACLELAGAVETFPFNPETSVFKVGGKIFAISQLDAIPVTVSLKCDPELAVRLRSQHPEIVGGWHLNKRHWNTVRLDGALSDALVREMVEDSYDLVVSSLSRSEQRRLDWAGLRRRENETWPERASQTADRVPRRRRSGRGQD
jgi:predicted DNA-binding protein (MmcQ/YjbR family)